MGDTGFALIRACPACGTRNRVGARHLAATARCGACKTTIGAVAEPLEVDQAAFDEIVTSVQVPVLVDFWADWCGPCKMAAPEIHALARETAGRAVVLKVDIEDQPELATRYGVRAIPNFVVLKEGRMVRQSPGLVPRAEMRHWLDQAGAAA